MKIRTLVSPLALAVALSFSGGAMAQTSIGGMEIPAEDLPEVQNLCNTLLAAEGNASLTDTDDEDDGDDADDTNATDGTDDGDGDGDGDGDNGDGDDNGDDGDTEGDPAAEDDDPSGLDQALTTIDLDVVTLEMCREAGLVE